MSRIKDAELHVRQGEKNPYDADRKIPAGTCFPGSWEHRVVRGILHDLLGRRGIKWALEDVDLEVRCEIVDDLVDIVTYALETMGKKL